MPERKSKSERLIIVNETKMKCMEHDLTNDLATKILFTMLDNYHEKGTTYIGKELKLSGRHAVPRKYVVNLYNEKKKTDIVLIRALSEEEEGESARLRARKAVESQIPDVRHTWTRDPKTGKEEESSSESESESESSSDEAPDLEPAESN